MSSPANAKLAQRQRLSDVSNVQCSESPLLAFRGKDVQNVALVFCAFDGIDRVSPTFRRPLMCQMLFTERNHCVTNVA